MAIDLQQPPDVVLTLLLLAEISMYAIAQKEGNGLDKAVEDCKYRMKRYGVTV